VVSGNHEHAFDSVARSLLTERHLKDGVLDRFAGYLTTEHVELATGYFEVGRGVFVLAKHGMSIGRVRMKDDRTYLCCDLPGLDRDGFLLQCFKDTSGLGLSASYRFILGRFLPDFWREFFGDPR